MVEALAEELKRCKQPVGPAGAKTEKHTETYNFQTESEELVGSYDIVKNQIEEHIKHSNTSYQGPLLAAPFLLTEPGAEDGDQPGQGAAQAVGAVGDAIEGEGQGEDEQGGHWPALTFLRPMPGTSVMHRIAVA